MQNQHEAKRRPPVVSVVTISYNQARFLESALNSILNQEDVEIEYIVIDAGSTDESQQIIDRYKDRLAHAIFERDNGPADGLNKGLRLATGEYFYYLNSDDVVAPGAFREAIAAFETDPELSVVYGNGSIIDENDQFVRSAYSSPLMSPGLYARGLAVVLQQATFFRTESLKAVGGFNVENKTCWDGEALFDIAHHGGRFRRVWRDWGRFRIYAESISGSGRLNEAYARDQARIGQKILASTPRWHDRFVTRLLYLLTRSSDWRRLKAELTTRLNPRRLPGDDDPA